MTATSHYNSSNAVTVSQTINAGNPFVDLSYSINFYDSADYTNKVDFSSTSITVGNTLFAQIEAPELINDTKFIVKRCTVTDNTDAGYSLMLVNNFCPIDNGLNFRWRSDSTSDSVVQFEYTNFIFPGSSETTEMTLDCEINLCHVDDSECLKGCEKHILVFPSYMADAYTISSSGQMTDVSVSAPSTIDSNTINFAEYTGGSHFAVVRGEMYVFGGGYGMESNQKIAMLNGCEFTELPVKFTFYYGAESAALAIDGGMQALVCFDTIYGLLTHENKGKRCEVFDAFTTAPTTFVPQYHHGFGKLGMYQGQPTTAGGTSSLNVGPFKKVETLTPTGWTSLADHPKNIRAHVLIGLDSGAMVMAGGYNPDIPDLTREIWLLKDGLWSNIEIKRIIGVENR
ncbi:Oidioi.mRNA.OKI2018_I69.chr2.g4235.t2.cds [Oikopleura dioica]|uniref:Oidioi.mRNA.OKI2018_I69.chr2.g4235.t2.cds n=1 Tax=Oikopleura dioica TaxID=34765 RepID=A0ABN7T0I6_OIKDI|nr:Oidioi.mRNA.OKI2018_I69.chr2.g4235.t2.cds [Oikopleura dioica]